jgi:hypothetical protein
MAETNLTGKSAKLRAGTGELSRSAGCQSGDFDNQETIAVSKTAASVTVVQLRPTTILTTRTRSKRANAGDKRTYLTEAEVERLIKAAETPRDKAMILIGYRGTPMTRQAFDKMLRTAGAKAGLPDVHPHLLRHGCGFRLVNLGLDTLSLAEEHERGSRQLGSPQGSQSADLSPCQGVNAAFRPLQPLNLNPTSVEINLAPAQVDEFGYP